MGFSRLFHFRRGPFERAESCPLRSTVTLGGSLLNQRVINPIQAPVLDGLAVMFDDHFDDHHAWTRAEKGGRNEILPGHNGINRTALDRFGSMPVIS